MAIKLLELEARPTYRLWLRFDDGIEGEVDLSHLVTGPAFQAWKDESFFRTAAIGSHGEIEWGEAIELCADALYLRISHKSVEDLMPGLRKATVGA